MGVFTVPIEVSDLEGIRSERIDTLVDTGASHTRIPRPIFERLGVVPHERMPFRLADESVIEYDLGEAQIRIDGRFRYSPVIFGEEGTQPLLGASTLEIFGLGVNPVDKRLVPVTGIFL